MKNYGNRVYVTACIIALGLSAGTFVSANAAPAIMNATPAQPVDLTYAAEKAVPAVVHIKYVQNSKMQTVDAEGGILLISLIHLVSLEIQAKIMEGIRNARCRLLRRKLPVAAL